MEPPTPSLGWLYCLLCRAGPGALPICLFQIRVVLRPYLLVSHASMTAEETKRNGLIDAVCMAGEGDPARRMHRDRYTKPRYCVSCCPRACVPLKIQMQRDCWTSSAGSTRGRPACIFSCGVERVGRGSRSSIGQQQVQVDRARGQPRRSLRVASLACNRNTRQ